MSRKTDTVWVDVEVIWQTGQAWKVTDGKHEAWLPMSAIIDSTDEVEVGASMGIEIAVSLAEDKGLV